MTKGESQLEPNARIGESPSELFRGDLGAEFGVGSQPSLDTSEGYHTATISPSILVPSTQFYFGATQPGPENNLWWGLDVSSGEGGTESFVRFPQCGLESWGTLTSIGYAGDWVMAVCVSGATPVELDSWGQLKQVWN